VNEPVRQEDPPRRKWQAPNVTGAISQTRRFLTLANLISLGRLVLLFPLFVFLREGQRENGNQWALVIMGIALLSDMLDGMLARLLKQISDWGKVLDPIADKLWINFLGLFLAMPWREHPLPWQFYGLILLRDISIVGGAFFAYRRTGIVMASNVFGKVTMVAEALALIAYTVYWQPGFAPWLKPELLVWIVTVMILASGLTYTLRLRDLLVEHSRHTPVRNSPPPLKISS
jgi:CDP-diacylglycerol--glycerol-3-phosphate 3-phosphatidyltransferase